MGHLAQVEPSFNHTTCQGMPEGQMGLSVMWPGGGQQVGAALANMSYGLITGDSDPREQSSGFGQAPVRAAPRSPAASHASRGMEEWWVLGETHDSRTQNWPGQAGGRAEPR